MLNCGIEVLSGFGIKVLQSMLCSETIAVYVSSHPERANVADDRVSLANSTIKSIPLGKQDWPTLMHSSVVCLNCPPKLNHLCEWEVLEIFATSFASYMYINTCNIFEQKFATYMYASKSHTLCGEMMHWISVGETANKKGVIFNCSRSCLLPMFLMRQEVCLFRACGNGIG